MYVFFILAIVVAAFGGPLIGAGSQAERSAAMIDTARTRVIAEQVIAHHQAALEYARENPTFSGQITADMLTFNSGPGAASWELYGSRPGHALRTESSDITSDFVSWAEPDANALVTYSLTGGTFTGGFDREYDRSGVLKRMSMRASRGTFVGVIESSLSAEERFRGEGSVLGFGSDTPPPENIGATEHMVSPLGRIARALPFPNADFQPGVIVLATQYGLGARETCNPFANGAGGYDPDTDC